MGDHAEGDYINNVTLSGTITAIDETNLKVTVSGLPRTGVDYMYQLFSTNTSFYGNQYISAYQTSSSTHTFTLSK